MRERETNRARWVPAVTLLDPPLLLVWGDQDPVGVWAIALEVKRLRPTTLVCRLPGIGHYPQLEAPEQVAAALLEFLR